MTEPVVLTVKMVGAQLAAKDVDGLSGSLDDLSGSAKGVKSSAADAAKSVDSVSKSTQEAGKAADTAGKKQGGFFAGLRDGWRQAKAEAMQSSEEIAKSSSGSADEATGGWKGFFEGLKEGWGKAKEDAEDGGKKSGEGFVDSIGGKIKAGIAALGIGKFLWDSIQSAIASDAVQNQLEDAFSRFPKLADTNIAKIEELAAAREKLTRFDADSTKASVANLAQMHLSGKQIEQLIPLIQDYAAKTGKDMDQATKSVTDGFLGNTDALRDAGITYKSTGSAGYDYIQMVKALRAQVGGFAEKEGKFAGGTLDQLKIQFANVQQELGEKLLPYAIKFGDWIKNTGLPLFEKFIDWLADLGKNLEPIVDYFTSAQGAWVRFTAAIAASAIVFKSHPVFAVAAAVAYIIANWDKVKDAWSGKSAELTPELGPDGKPLTSTLPDGTKVTKMITPGEKNSGLAGHANGTVLSGYAPGRDTEPAMLSKGEAVLVPELVRAIGANNINAANWKYSAGRRGYAFGGISGTNPTYTKDPMTAAMLASSLQSVFSLGSNTATAGAPQASVSPSGDDPVGRWKNVATQALQITGDYTPENLAAMMKRIGWESTGNPNAVNDWDRNAKNGTPSKGLLQVIQPTFDKYALPGYDKNILDPLSNIIASIQYAKATYPSLQAAYLKRNADGSVAGYDNGGWLQPGGGMGVNMLSQPEPVLTPRQWDTAESAIQHVQENGGGTTTIAPVFNIYSDSPDEIIARLRDEIDGILEESNRRANTKRL